MLILNYMSSAVSVPQLTTGPFEKLKLHQVVVVQKVISELEVFPRLTNWFPWTPGPEAGLNVLKL